MPLSLPSRAGCGSTEDAKNQLHEAEASEAQIRERLGLATGDPFDPLKTPEGQQARVSMDRAEADYQRYAQLVDERADSRALVVEAIVPNQQGVLQPGLFATAHIQLPGAHLSVLIPTAAVRNEGGVSSFRLGVDLFPLEKNVDVGAQGVRDVEANPVGEVVEPGATVHEAALKLREELRKGV